MITKTKKLSRFASAGSVANISVNDNLNSEDSVFYLISVLIVRIYRHYKCYLPVILALFTCNPVIVL